MTERQKFVRLVLKGQVTMTQACQQFGISRKTGYKVLARHAELGMAGLADAPRAPKTVLLRCLAKRPEHLPGSFAQIRQELQSMPILEPWTPDLAQQWWQAHAVVASPAARPSDATMPTRTWLAHDQPTRPSGPRE